MDNKYNQSLDKLASGGQVEASRRVFVPKVNADGTFKTLDGTRYRRDGNGCIRRV